MVDYCRRKFMGILAGAIGLPRIVFGRGRGRGAGPGFSARDRYDVVPPSENMTLWFRGDKGITLNSFSEVTRWNDLSGGGLFARDQTGTAGVVPISDIGAITAFADGGVNIVTVTSNSHTALNIQPVTIAGTTNYDGVYTILAASVTANTFDITVSGAFPGDDATGTWRTSKRPTLTSVNDKQGLLFDGIDDAMSVDFPVDKGSN